MLRGTAGAKEMILRGWAVVTKRRHGKTTSETGRWLAPLTGLAISVSLEVKGHSDQQWRAMKNSILFALLVCLLTPGLHAQVRKCIGSDGKVHYRDEVCADARADNPMSTG